MSDPINFDRKPYFVSWKDESGEMHKIRRVPPPKLHEALPEDMVKLTKTKSDDFKEGAVLKVKNITNRQPNTLQLVDDDGKTTFVNYSDVELKEKRAARNGIPPEALPERNRYLLWP